MRISLSSEVLASRNREHGFFGTARHYHSVAETTALWKQAFHKVKDHFKADDVDVRNFLDSQFGRYIADVVHNHDEDLQSAWTEIKADPDLSSHFKEVVKNRKLFD